MHLLQLVAEIMRQKMQQPHVQNKKQIRQQKKALSKSKWYGSYLMNSTIHHGRRPRATKIIFFF